MVYIAAQYRNLVHTLEYKGEGKKMKYCLKEITENKRKNIREKEKKRTEDVLVVHCVPEKVYLISALPLTTPVILQEKRKRKKGNCFQKNEVESTILTGCFNIGLRQKINIFK